jgi:hypothetical protein
MQDWKEAAQKSDAERTLRAVQQQRGTDPELEDDLTEARAEDRGPVAVEQCPGDARPANPPARALDAKCLAFRCARTALIKILTQIKGLSSPGA